MLRALLLALLPVAALAQAQPERTFAVGAAEDVSATRWMVIAAHPLAASAGAEILREGGSAADAAVAVQLALTLVEPQSSGLGGGAFALHWDAAARSLTTWDGRETAPASAGPDYWMKDGAPMAFRDAVPGGRSVGVPGTPALLQALHDAHGVLPRERLAAPAIRLAEEGFPVSPRLAASVAEAAEGLALFPATAAYFLPGGAPLEAGATLRNPQLAATFRRFAAEGAAPFYRGDLAANIVHVVRGAAVNPGVMTRRDLEDYEAKLRPPVCAPWRGMEVCGMGPPSSGALTVGQILMLAERAGIGAEPSEAGWRVFAEATRLAFADRGLYMADADFVAMPEGLLNPGYMDSRATLISPERGGEPRPGEPPWKEGALLAPDRSAERPGTSHFVIRDAAGNVVSMTTTIETGFGSRLMANGYLLNNELTDFSFVAEENGAPVANRVEGGKRPRSSMAPTIALRRGEPVLALGSPGGARIIAYVAQALIAMEAWGMSPAEAAAIGHVTAFGGAVDLEEKTEAAALAEGFAAYGLEPRVRNLNSGLAILRIGRGGMTGSADPRREGVAIGE